MRKLIPAAAALLVAAVAFSISGCIETKNAATVNPNGSAKVAVDIFLPNPAAMMGGGPGGGAGQPTPEESAKKQANDFLGKAAGVDAWSDITIEATKDGRTHVKATAFTPDISKFKLDMIPPVKWTVDNAGNGQLELVMDGPGGGPAAEPAASQPKLTAEEIAKKLEKERSQFNEGKPMMGAILDKMKIEATYTLPGKISDAAIFTKSGDNTATFTMEGKKMLEAMDKLINDDAKMIAIIKSGKSLDNNPDASFEMMYGQKGPAVVKVTGATKALFDYEKESAAAKTAQPELLKKLGIDLKPAPEFNFGPPGGPR
jgi:hypothetical protein